MLRTPDARDPDRVWRALRDHVEPFEIFDSHVPALDVVGRCLVLALHALGNGPSVAQSVEDLARARRLAGSASWAQVQVLAQSIDALPLVEAGLTLVESGPMPKNLPIDARLRLRGDDGSAFQLERLLASPVKDVPVRLDKRTFSQSRLHAQC